VITGSDIAPGKRLFDVAVSLTALVLLVPVLVVIALLVRLGSPGPVLYRQQRVSRGGRLFELLKFRTMVVGADRMAANVSATGDPRVTRVGAFLRKSYLDELPQLFNVLRGDMSLVGPRPEELWLVERYGETQRFRLQMRPGLTGPMQVHGRGELNFQERLAVEREYVENYSIRKDLKILLRTIWTIWRGPGAY
jgi:lipopolysaccharide/colanic/teichoic acid biosynthesis glycosyltransferase